LFNPCFEISFLPVTEDGQCGIQFCNLTSINGSKVETEDDFYEYCKYQAIIGTLQAGYTDFPFLNNASKKLTEEEALLGCSITGIMNNPKILLNPKILERGAKICVDTNKEWAKKIGINQAARVTCIKPEGTGSLVLADGKHIPASGIHPHHAKRYFRRVQCNKADTVYKYFKKHNPHMCEESVWSANKTDDVITFPIELKEDIIIKDDLTAIQHLEYAKLVYKHWVLPGTTEVNKKPVTHNVSLTVEVKPDEWDEVTEYLFKNRKFFGAVSLLPKLGDKIYKQAPLERITTEEDEEKLKMYKEKYKPVDYSLLIEDDDNTQLQSELVCAGGACLI
jgi:ribonucleoside-diphosphate reductase alpha chain